MFRWRISPLRSRWHLQAQQRWHRKRFTAGRQVHWIFGYIEHVHWSFRLTSYNVLADAYASKRLYPDADPQILSWERRGPALVSRVVGLSPDVVCLQEVQASHWPALRIAFGAAGWEGHFAQKGQARADGCAMLWRAGALKLDGFETLYYEDGGLAGKVSGHVALIGSFESPIGRIRIATTHLRWQAPSKNPEGHIGYREAEELLEYLTGAPGSVVVCGDFNVLSNDPVCELLRRRGFVDAYEPAPQFTCNSNGLAKRIDFVFATEDLPVSPEPIPELYDASCLPNAHEPSDHLPLTVRLRRGISS